METSLAAIGWPVIDRVHFGGDFAISPHGVGIAIGYLMGSWWMLRESPRRGIREEHAYSLLFWALIGTIFGSRFFYVVGHYSEFNSFADMLKIYKGGLTLLGAIAGSLLFAYPVMRRHRYRFLQVTDSAAIGLAFGLFVGRIGDLIIGDHLGKPTNLPWAFSYKGGNLSGFACGGGVCRLDLLQGQQTLVISKQGAALCNGVTAAGFPCGDVPTLAQGAGVHQTALYDFVGACLLFLFLLLVMNRRLRREGVMTMTFAIWYGLTRVGTDFLRVDKRFFGLTGSQWTSVVVVALSVAVLTAWAVRSRRRRPPPEEGRVPTTAFTPPAEPPGGL